MMEPGIFLLTTPNMSTCRPKAQAPGQHTHAESTCWGQEFFIYHPNKSTRLPKAQAPGEHAHAESTCLPKAQAPGEHILGPGIFY